jgi:geranylgeranyl reductase family protein
MASVDIAVVGAGPAGAWTAWCLAQRGARVLLIDGSHPREKPCGGGVTARALDLVSPALSLGDLPRVAIRSARFSAASSTHGVGVPLATGALIVASRRDFDGLIFAAARRAKIEVLEARATDVREVGGGFEIETTAGPRRVPLLVGADGASSVVRRRLASPFQRAQLSIATGFFAHGVTSQEIVVEWIADPPGYIWSFPRPAHLAIGICAQADCGVSSTALRRLALSWIERTGIAAGARLEPYAWPIPSLSAGDLDKAAVSGSRWYLVGDAAGLVDPITREGIYFALQSGQWAADAVADGHGPLRYRSRIRDQIGVELVRAAQMKDAFFQARFTRVLIDALRQSESICGVMADFIAGRQSYAGLTWRLAATLELGIAARLLLNRPRSRRAPERAGPAAAR